MPIGVQYGSTALGSPLIGVDTTTLAGNDRSAIPPDATRVSATSGNVAASTATAALPAVSGKFNYCTAIELDYQGATAASVVVATLTGGAGSTRVYAIPVPAGATVVATPFIVQFEPPLQSSATNTAITFTVPSLGTGNTTAANFIEGYAA